MRNRRQPVASSRPAAGDQFKSWFTRSELIVLALIVVVQAIWLFWVMNRGWYLQSELSNLADARGKALTWSYLSESIGGHFGPIGRLDYWLLGRCAPLNYPLTAAARITFQAVTTVLLYRILVLVAGHHWRNMTIVVLYAFSSLLLPGLVWLSSGIGLAQAQALVMIAILWLVRFVAEGRLRFAATCGLALVMAIMTADLMAVYALVFPLLVIGYLYKGSARQRFHALIQHWLGWLIVAAPLVAYLAFYASHGYSHGSSAPGLRVAFDLSRAEWLKVFGTALVGGPWQWFADPHTYVAFAAPPGAAVVIGQLALAVLLVIGFYNLGWRVLVAWALPVVVALGNVLIVGVGRFDTYGDLIPLTLRYSYPLAVPLAIAVALTFAESDSAQREQAGRHDRFAAPSLAVLATCVLVLVASLVSAARFVAPWSRNPTRSYVANLARDARAVGPSVNIYDTAVRDDVVSGVEPHHYVSDLLGLANVKARFNDLHTTPLVADLNGHLVPATFVAASHGEANVRPNCGLYLAGSGSWRIPLSNAVPRAEWFVQLSLYQARPSDIDVMIEDAGLDLIAPIGGSHVQLPTTLAQVNRRLPTSSPTAIVIKSNSTEFSMCLSQTLIGGPFPAAR